MADITVLKRVVEDVEAGRELALVTITKSDGSTPRAAGAMMAVLADGSIYGTIGGGTLEKKVTELSIKAIKEGRSKSVYIPLDKEGVEMTCGGDIDVFIDVYRSKPKLLIAGGGHVAYAIYKVASLLDFDIIIFEDREEFLNRERFPKAYELVLGKIDEKLEEYNIDANTYVVIATRGHKYDEESLEKVIYSDAKYIGVIGSKTKVATMMNNLKKKNISEESIEKVYSPIGLKISDGTPAEIAISILAEILKVKNVGQLSHMKQ